MENKLVNLTLRRIGKGKDMIEPKPVYKKRIKDALTFEDGFLANYEAMYLDLCNRAMKLAAIANHYAPYESALIDAPRCMCSIIEDAMNAYGIKVVYGNIKDGD